jgi:hypothetical protein
MYSVVTAYDHLRGSNSPRIPREIWLTGVSLMVLAAYLGGYVLLRAVVSSRYIVVTVTNGMPGDAVATGDSILIRRSGQLRRGDFALATVNGRGAAEAAVGPILGLPGDRVYVSDQIYVNGRPAHVGIQWPEELGYPDTNSPGSVILGRGEYWMRANFTGHGEDNLLQLMAESGRIYRDSIWGKAVAIIGPPARRRLLNETLP